MARDHQVAVERNLAFMGTPTHEWAAVPVLSMHDSESGMMPTFSMPDGYGHAKSLYPCSDMNPCCELCGHPIKNVFYLQNDSRRLLLIVGSECVTHFAQGASGADLLRDAARDHRRATLARFIEFREKMRARLNREWTYPLWQNFSRLSNALPRKPIDKIPDKTVTVWYNDRRRLATVAAKACDCTFCEDDDNGAG